MAENNQAKFEIGQLVATRGAMAKVNHEEILKAIARHIKGDYGDMCPEDCKSNEDALKFGGRIFSSYKTADGIKFWVITEGEGSGIVTTVLLPSEY
jgi:hypothetical protein